MIDKMKYFKEKSYCRKCDDYFYNPSDIDSIKTTRHCVFCAKEIKMKNELVELEKKRKMSAKRKVALLGGNVV